MTPWSKMLVHCVLVLFSLFKALAAVRISPVTVQLSAPPSLTGSLEPNDLLTSAERYKYGHVSGPESFVFHNGHIYTVSSNGLILDISECQTRKVARIGGDNCYGNNCGRPVAIRIDNLGRLIVADTVKGIIRVEPATGKQEVLYSAITKVRNRASRFINDLAVARDGTVVFSDTSSKWTRSNFFYSILEGEATGRILAYSPVYKKTLVLLDNLRSPTGVEFTPDEQSLLISEAGMARIIKLHLTPGANWLKQETFADNLPGFPENIRKSGRGTYWVPFTGSRNNNTISLLDRFGTTPKMRGVAAMITSHDQLVRISSKYAMVVELNQNGGIIRSFQDPTGKSVGPVTEVMEQHGYLYLGSLDRDYVTRVPLTKTLHVERVISKLTSTCRAKKKSNISKLRQLLKRLVALAEFRKVLLQAKKAREELERRRLASTTTTSRPIKTSPAGDPATTSAPTSTASSSITDSTTTSATGETTTSLSGEVSSTVTSSSSTASTTSAPDGTTTVKSSTPFNDDVVVTSPATSASTASTQSTTVGEGEGIVTESTTSATTSAATATVVSTSAATSTGASSAAASTSTAASTAGSAGADTTSSPP